MWGDGEGDSWSGALLGCGSCKTEALGRAQSPGRMLSPGFCLRCGCLGRVCGVPRGDMRLCLPLESRGACGCPRLLGGVSRSHGLGLSLAPAQVLAAAALLLQQVTRAPEHPDGSLGDPRGQRAAARSRRAWLVTGHPTLPPLSVWTLAGYGSSGQEFSKKTQMHHFFSAP